MPRVVHVSQPTSHGVARVVRHLVEDQVAAGWDVFTVCPPSGPLPVEAAAAGARVLSWQATRAPGSTTGREAFHLQGLIESVGADLVHLHSAKAGLAGRLAVRGRRPTVFQPHAWSFWAAAGWQRAGSTTWERYAARWADRVICASEQEKGEAERRGIKLAGVVVPNGVDTGWFAAQDGATRRRARADLGLAEAPTAVCVARLWPQKGQDILLRAWPAVLAAVPDARLVLVGDGPDRATLEAMAPPSVRFAGSVTDPRPWYAAADVVVLPSRWEDQALVQLEAMASARSVVTTAVSGAREALPPDGGAVVPVGDEPAIAAAVAARLGHPALTDAEGAAGRVRACAAHDLRGSAGRIRDVYADLVRLAP
jgi:glycosyltransferase involved in cell wall biosynthesis